MSDYTKSTNFATKDNLSSGNSLKIVKGTEIDTEFNNIATAVATKADLTSPTFTGTPTLPTGTIAVTQSSGSNTTTIATTAFVQAAIALLYPVGSVYTNASVSTNPGTLLGFGTWTAFGAGRVMVGFDSSNALFDTAEETGGSANAIVVTHNHTATSSVSDSGHSHGVNTIFGYDNSQPSTCISARSIGPSQTNLVTQSATTGISVSIYSATGSTPTPNGMITSSSVIRNSDIQQGTNEYTLKFDNGANLEQGTSYWLMINKPVDFTTGLGSTSLYTRIISGSSGQGLTSINNGSSWTGTGGTAYCKFRGYLDNGNISGDILRRGIKLTNRIALQSSKLSVYVPYVEDLTSSNVVFNGSTTGIATTDDQTIKNDLVVTVIAQNGENGELTTLTTTVPKGTTRNQRFPLGNDLQVFDRVIDAYVTPGTDLTRINNGPILWDIYDLITIETTP